MAKFVFFDQEFYVTGYDSNGDGVLNEKGKGLTVKGFEDILIAIVEYRRDVVRIKIEIAIERKPS